MRHREIECLPRTPRPTASLPQEPLPHAIPASTWSGRHATSTAMFEGRRGEIGQKDDPLVVGLPEFLVPF
jgi:hypothetical protein